MTIRLLETWVKRELARAMDSADVGHEQLGRLTIVVPSYERQGFLLRQIAYWAHSSANIVIVDGSKEPLSQNVRGMIECLRNLSYIHSRIDMYGRLRLAAEQISTPYAITQGDDEFFLKSSLCQAIDRLDLDPKLVACNGQSIGFRHVVQNGQGFVERYDAGYAHWRYSVVDDKANDRLQYAMSSYNAATSYAVLRAQVWRTSWGDLQAWSSPYAGEMYQAIATYLAGGLETIDEILLLRSGENEPISSTMGFNRKLQFDDWWRLPNYEDEREEFIERLARMAMCETGVSITEAREMVVSAVLAYLCLCGKISRWSRVRALRDNCRASISGGLRRILTREQVLGLKRTISHARRGRLRRDVAAASLVQGKVPDSVVERELSGIESLLRDFYEVLSMEQIK